MSKINVNLYGGKSLFGGKETPLEAEIIYCDMHENCSLYKENKCLRCRMSFTSNVCKYGSCNTVKGYTSRASKYHEFKDKYTEDENYSKLEHPNYERFAVVGNYYWFNFSYLYVAKYDPEKHKDNCGRQIINNYVVDSSCFAQSSCFIDKSDMTAEFLDAILSKTPRSFMGSIISEYQSKVVPDIVNQMKKVDTELFDKLCAVNEKYKNMLPNYLGKYAYISTLVSGSVIKDCHGDEYTVVKDDNMIDTYLAGTVKSGWVPFSAKEASVKVILKGTETIKVENNDWCDDKTKFS